MTPRNDCYTWRRLSATLALLAAVSCAAPPSVPVATDIAAIDSTLDDWYQAWRVGDPVLAASGYSDDADFTNAFGMRCSGRAEIQELLERVFAMDFVMAGDSHEGPRDVRFLGPDVALVRSTVERDGQETATGEALGTRRTSHLRVLVREGGEWRIVSHLISDARATERSGH